MVGYDDIHVVWSLNSLVLSLAVYLSIATLLDHITVD